MRAALGHAACMACLACFEWSLDAGVYCLARLTGTQQMLWVPWTMNRSAEASRSRRNVPDTDSAIDALGILGPWVTSDKLSCWCSEPLQWALGKLSCLALLNALDVLISWCHVALDVQKDPTRWKPRDRDPHPFRVRYVQLTLLFPLRKGDFCNKTGWVPFRTSAILPTRSKVRLVRDILNHWKIDKWNACKQYVSNHFVVSSR